VAPHTHLRLRLADADNHADAEPHELRFSDPRRFGELLLVDAVGFTERFGLDRLGPDALGVPKKRFAERLRATDRRIKGVLLDQRVLAGVGNIYADEACHAAGVAPRRKAADLTDAEIAALHHALGAVLRRAVKHNGTTIRDYVDGRGASGGFQDFLRVYGRAGLPCKKCGAEVQMDRTTVAGRATCWCPQCQK
ncbi:MAG: Fpg/Nei family DNA glycosylase, partial [Planctomycetia bacterium]